MLASSPVPAFLKRTDGRPLSQVQRRERAAWVLRHVTSATREWCRPPTPRAASEYRDLLGRTLPGPTDRFLDALREWERTGSPRAAAAVYELGLEVGTACLRAGLTAYYREALGLPAPRSWER